MEAPFDPIKYFEDLYAASKDLNGIYEFSRVSGISYLEEVLNDSKGVSHFYAVDDSDDGELVQDSGGFVERRTVTVFLLQKLGKWPDMAGRKRILSEVRPIFRKLAAKMNNDRYKGKVNIMFPQNRIPYFEMPGYFGPGCAGLYFMVTFDNPVDLVMDAADWQ